MMRNPLSEAGSFEALRLPRHRCHCQFEYNRSCWTRRFRNLATNNRLNLFHQNLMGSWLTSIPRSWS